ncbi:VanZ family protein [Sinomonas sp. ASV486]|uniref:VanZ family protein n=1 Tax=Sinomonas sp. ASV486 TaxID=3051170 RepID=UPI0027DD656E|nr:VanZ family protein [Sinomonas sp. ASV486]MDQ4490357.1 VanZ family protein [Sinomonas sp. ASV486]
MRRRTAWWALAVYGLAVAAVVFAPVGPSLKGVPLPGWLHAGAIDAAANVAIFVPGGFLVAQLLPRGRRWLAVAICCGVSATIEAVQAFFLPERSGNVRDVVTNTTGALIGMLAFIVWLRVLGPRGLARSTDASPHVSESSTRSYEESPWASQ